MMIVLDTSALVSGILWKGAANNLLKHIEESDKIELAQCQETFDDLVKILSKGKFSKFLKNRSIKIDIILESLESGSKFFSLSDSTIDKVMKEITLKHIEDMIFLALALEAKANYLISYNINLLELVSFKNLKIVTPEYYMEMVYKEKRKHRRFNFKDDVLGYFQLKADIEGSFKNYEKFLLYNISLGGFNLLSNYSPEIGSKYLVQIEIEEKRVPFEVEIVHTQVSKMIESSETIFKPGTIYSIGCKIIFLNDEQKDNILFLIRNKCAYVEPKFLKDLTKEDEA
jgi:putative PIN family toxin of toxin-antitoxin system